MRARYRLCAGIFSLLICMVLGFTLYFQNVLPDSFQIARGDELTLPARYSCVTCSTGHNIFPVEAYAHAGNQYTVKLKFLGVVDIKQVSVQVVQRKNVAVCGTPFGIKLFTDGVMVVGLGAVPTDSGNVLPAREVGIQRGDIILSLSGETKLSNQVISALVKSSHGRPMEVRYQRGNDIHRNIITPVLSSADHQYHIGLWVRDSSAGIGTLTFCDPETGTFAGLGHAICDVDTGQLMPLLQGEIVHASITGVSPGHPGSPGELQGIFRDSIPWGQVHMNHTNGIYGKFVGTMEDFEVLPAAMNHEVSVGPAHILTTVHGDTPRMFQVRIEKICSSRKDESRNMIVRITDPELLSLTGGIVQGMSGSPILQNGKLVGAVTHVLVNDPARGYGIFIENMLEAAG